MISENYRQTCWNETEWLYIQGLSKAIDNVPKEYIRECNDKRKFHMERVFAYELYYRWKKLLNNRQENPEKLMLNAELSKHYFKKDKYKFPDMVLHGNYTDCEKQYIICEIKSSRNPIKDASLKKDIDSLCGGISELSYRCGVFIYLGDRVNNIVSKLHAYLNNNQGERRVLFIGVNCGESHYEIL